MAIDDAAQGAGGAAAAGNQGGEPTVQDDGFTPEERQQFAEMQSADSDGGDAGGAAGEQGGAAAGEQGAGAGAAAGDEAAKAAAAAATGKKVAGEEDDDDEPEAGQAGDQAGQQRPPRRVNWNKFQRMEERATAAERERDQFKETFARTDERLKLINEALSAGGKQQQKANEQEDPEPDREKDLFGWTSWASRQMANMSKLISGQQQEKQVSEEERTTANNYVEDVRRFVASEAEGKNFGNAYQFLMDQRMGTMAFYYFGKNIVQDDGKLDLTQLSVEQVNKLKAEIAGEERELVTTMLAQKQSPAKAVYQMARLAGFRPAAVAAGGQQAGAGAGNGAGGGKAPGSLAEGAGGAGQGQGGGQARPGQGTQGGNQGNQGAQPNVAEEIARVRNGQAANMSLSNGAGSPGQQTLTPERLANMSQAEFSALMEQIGDQGFQRIVEGSAA